MCFRVILILLGFFVSCHSGDYKINPESKESLVNIFMIENGEYHIAGQYSLANDTLFLPRGAIIVFDRDAKIEDGVVIGNKNTIISYSKKPIFKNISFAGTFEGVASAEWFSLIYGKAIDNSFELNSALNLAHLSSVKELKLPYSKTLYVRSDVENSRTKHFLYEGTVEIKSNVCFDLNRSTIRCLPNSAKQYNILFSRQSQNIIIRNGIICGDLKKHNGDDGEWGYGIELQGVHGFLLENLECCYCWGDGINIQVSSDGDGNPESQVTRKGHCSNGVIRNVNCHHNRRQGMSLEGITKLDVTNSSFNDTDGTNPRSGLDIEPYSKNNIVTDVTIKACEFKNNAYSGLLIMSNEGNVRDVRIDSCCFESNDAYDITMTGNRVKITGCPVNKNAITLKLVGDCDGIDVKTCQLSKISAQDFSQGHHVRNVIFEECKLFFPQRKVSVAFGDDLSLTDCDLTFNNCMFDYSTTVFKKGLFSLNRNSPYKYLYNNCVFYLGRNNLKIVNCQIFNKCHFYFKAGNISRSRLDDYINNSPSFKECEIVVE